MKETLFFLGATFLWAAAALTMYERFIKELLK